MGMHHKNGYITHILSTYIPYMSNIIHLYPLLLTYTTYVIFTNFTNYLPISSKLKPATLNFPKNFTIPNSSRPTTKSSTITSPFSSTISSNSATHGMQQYSALKSNDLTFSKFLLNDCGGQRWLAGVTEQKQCSCSEPTQHIYIPQKHFTTRKVLLGGKVAWARWGGRMLTLR